jgi:hypothetical protein
MCGHGKWKRGRHVLVELQPLSNYKINSRIIGAVVAHITRLAANIGGVFNNDRFVDDVEKSDFSSVHATHKTLDTAT